MTEPVLSYDQKLQYNKEKSFKHKFITEHGDAFNIQNQEKSIFSEALLTQISFCPSFHFTRNDLRHQPLSEILSHYWYTEFEDPHEAFGQLQNNIIEFKTPTLLHIGGGPVFVSDHPIKIVHSTLITHIREQKIRHYYIADNKSGLAVVLQKSHGCSILPEEHEVFAISYYQSEHQQRVFDTVLKGTELV